VTLLIPVVVWLILAIPSNLASLDSGRGYAIAFLDSTTMLFEPLRSELEDATWGRTENYDLLEAPLGLRRADLLTWIQEGALDAALIVTGSNDCAESAELLASSRTDSLTLLHIGTALSRLSTQLRLRRYGVESARIRELTQPFPLDVVRVGPSGGVDAERLFPLVFFMAMILYMTLLIYGMSTMRSVVEEKSSRIVEILLTSVRPAELLAGKILGIAFVGLTQYLVWISFSSLVSGGFSESHGGIVSLFGDWHELAHVWIRLLPAMIGFFVLGYLLYACLYALAGALAGQPSDTQHLQFPITVMLLIPIVLLPFAVSVPASPLIRALSLVPFLSPILMFCRIAVSDPATWEAVLSLILLFLAVGIAWRLAARVYRVTILLYGKRLTLKEVARWVQHD
jgi:ABC-2 type transport system permease protein